MDALDFGESLKLKGVPCVFLDETTNFCTVYEYRPMTCRVSISVDDPKKCETEEFRNMFEAKNILMDVVRLVGLEHAGAYNKARSKSGPADIRQFFRPASIN